MPLPPNSLPRPPEAFAALLATKDPVLLVGGQAVNLWALYYKERTIELAPFVSRDVDVLGDLQTLEALGQAAGIKPLVFPIRPPTNEVGVVIAKDAMGAPLLVDVLRYVHGIRNEDLQQPVYTMAIGETHVRVPGPVALLQAKIANVADISQVDRQDARHVTILVRLLPAYLDDLQLAASEGRLEERKLIDFLERLLRVLDNKTARDVFDQLRLDARQIFAGLGHGKLEKLRSFLTKRLPRALTQSS